MKRTAFLVLLIIGIVALWWILVRGDTGVPTYEAVQVERGTVEHVVSVTGHVEPLARIELSFPLGGTVSEVKVSELARVDDGALLVSLDADLLNAQLNERAAQLAFEEARYAEILAPVRSEARAVQDAAVGQARAAVDSAARVARAALARAYVYADDALYEEIAEVFDDSRATPRFGVRFSYGTTEYVMRADTATTQALSEGFRAAQESLNTLEALEDGADIEGGLTEADTILRSVEEFANDVSRAINRYIPDDVSQQTIYEGFQTSVAAARTSLSMARSDVATAYSTYTGAVDALTRAQREEELATADVRDVTRAAQAARVAVARRAYELVREQYRDSILTAPHAGVVSQVYVDAGEAVAPYEPVLELISEGAYEIELYIPEADIASVGLGDVAHITFDAFDRSQVFEGEVVRIALGETLREGVPTYKTTVVLRDVPIDAPALKPGMTADVDIVTDMRADVLYVPVRSVVEEQGKKIVRVYSDDTFSEVPVETGLRGSEGTIEVLSGLSHGQEIVLYAEDL